MTHQKRLEAVVAYVVSMEELFSAIPLNKANVNNPEQFLIDNDKAVACVASKTINEYNGFFYKLYWFIGNLKTNLSEIKAIVDTLALINPEQV